MFIDVEQDITTQRNVMEM